MDNYLNDIKKHMEWNNKIASNALDAAIAFRKVQIVKMYK